MRETSTAILVYSTAYYALPRGDPEGAVPNWYGLRHISLLYFEGFVHLAGLIDEVKRLPDPRRFIKGLHVGARG